MIDIRRRQCIQSHPLHKDSSHRIVFGCMAARVLLSLFQKAEVVKMPSNEGALNVISQSNPFKVLVIGGSYAGLGTTLNLLDLCAGKHPRFAGSGEAPEAKKVPIDVTIVDERDGYCENNFESL